MKWIAACIAMLLPAAALAEGSAFGCGGIDMDAQVPALEGRDGVFYRINTDLEMTDSFTPATVRMIAALKDALAASGTTLVYVPVPTKAEAMPQFLPDGAAAIGYDSLRATQIYSDGIARLRAAKVLTADLIEAMRAPADEDARFFGLADTPVFYQTDYHWTAEGARRAARAVAAVLRADPAAADLVPRHFVTEPIGQKVAFSHMRRIIQSNCRDPLPEVISPAFTTTEVEAAPQDGAEGAATGLDIFADASDQGQVVLLGTSFSDSMGNNFAGWLSQYSGFEVLNYSVTGGGQLGALVSYLTSDEFHSQHPRFVIWENPAYSNVAQFGIGSIAELIAAASPPGQCAEILTTAIDGRRMRADLDGRSFRRRDAIAARFGAEGPGSAEFVLTTTSGVERHYWVRRDERVRRTGNFWLDLAPYAGTPLASVDVIFDRPIPSAPVGSSVPGLGLCIGKGGNI